MAIYNINTIQNNIDSTYTNEYLKQALANLSQRFSSKGDGIKTSSFKLKELFDLEKYPNLKYLCIQYNITDSTYTVIADSNTAVENENIVDKFILNEVAEGDLMKIVETIGNVKSFVNFKIIKNEDKYFFLGKGYDINDFCVEILSFEFDAKTNEVLAYNIFDCEYYPNIRIIKYENSSASNTYLNLDLSQSTIDSLYNQLYTYCFSDKDVLDYIDALNLDSLENDKVDYYNQKIDYYKNILTTYIKEFYNTYNFANTSDYSGLKKKILGTIVDKLYQDSGFEYSEINYLYNTYFSPEYEIKYFINDNTYAIYNSYEFIVNFQLKVNEDDSQSLTEETLRRYCVADSNYNDKFCSYIFLVTYLDDDKIVDKILVEKIFTFPYIGPNENNSLDVWYINDLMTDVRATGKDAGNPNIMMVSYTVQTKEEDKNNTSIEILHTFEDEKINKDELESMFYNEDFSNEYDFRYSLDNTNVNNSIYNLFDFKIRLPKPSELLARTSYERITLNSLLFTFVDMKISQNKINGKTLQQTINGDNENTSYICVFWHLLKDENEEWIWEPLYNPAFMPYFEDKNRNECPALDLGAMLSFKEIINYFVNTAYNPDMYEHSWVVFDPVNNIIKQSIKAINGEYMSVYPVFKVDIGEYYTNNEEVVYANDMQFVPKFLKADYIYADGIGIKEVRDKNIEEEDLHFTISDDSKIHGSYQINNDFIPNVTDEDNDVYPIFDFKEVIGNNLSTFNRLSLISVDKNNKIYHGFFGTLGDTTENKDILNIGTSKLNYNMAGNRTVTKDYDKFDIFKKLRIDIPTEFTNLIIQNLGIGNSVGILSISLDDENVNKFIENSTELVNATRYMKEVSKLNKVFDICEYLNAIDTNIEINFENNFKIQLYNLYNYTTDEEYTNDINSKIRVFILIFNKEDEKIYKLLSAKEVFSYDNKLILK